MLSLHLGLLLLISFPDLTAGMVLLHLFTFNPAWLRCGRRFERILHPRLWHGTRRECLCSPRDVDSNWRIERLIVVGKEELHA